MSAPRGLARLRKVVARGVTARRSKTVPKGMELWFGGKLIATTVQANYRAERWAANVALGAVLDLLDAVERGEL